MWSLQRSKYHISHHLSIDAIRHHSSTAVINFVYDIAQIKATIADSLLRQWVFAWRLWLRFRCVNDELWIMHTAWPIANLLICQHFRCRIGIAGLAAATTGWNRWDRLQFECWFVVPQFLFGNVNDFFDIRTIEWQFVEAILQILLWHNDTGAKGCFVGKTLANCIGRVFSANIKLNQYYLQKCLWWVELSCITWCHSLSYQRSQPSQNHRTTQRSERTGRICSCRRIWCIHKICHNRKTSISKAHTPPLMIPAI